MLLSPLEQTSGNRSEHISKPRTKQRKAPLKRLKNASVGSIAKWTRAFDVSAKLVKKSIQIHIGRARGYTGERVSARTGPNGRGGGRARYVRCGAAPPGVGLRVCGALGARETASATRRGHQPGPECGTTPPVRRARHPSPLARTRMESAECERDGNIAGQHPLVGGRHFCNVARSSAVAVLLIMSVGWGFFVFWWFGMVFVYGWRFGFGFFWVGGFFGCVLDLGTRKVTRF